MRLTPNEIAAIKAATAEIFGPNAVVRLFGSRTDDAARGGDIDLHVEVAPGRDGAWDAARLSAAVQKRLGPRRVDVVLSPRDHYESAVERRAVETGIVL